MDRRNSIVANKIYYLNQLAWEDVKKIVDVPCAPRKSVKKIVKPREMSSPPKEKIKRKKHGIYRDNVEFIKNLRFSFTSFLIPICITGEKKDYQLLYCISSLKNGFKIISTTLRKEGFAQLYMVGMKNKVDWEKVRENKISFDDILVDFLVKSGTVCMVAAEKREVLTKVHNPEAPFVVILSATDIQLPCGANLCVGSCWMIFRRSVESRKCLFNREVFNCGRRAIHTGILINGCQTTLVVAFKRIGGIHHFTFDIKTGDFSNYKDKCFMHQEGNLLTINEGLYYKFSPRIQQWLMKKKAKLLEKEYCSRYTGGWVTDCYKILCSGGLLVSPEDSEKTEGRIKYLCKAVPLAHMAEKAGGKATNGQVDILSIKISRYIFTSLVYGSVGEIDRYTDYVNKNEEDLGFYQTQYNGTHSDDTSTDIDA